MLPADSPCFECKHYHRDEISKPFNCDAYPEGIPHAILYGGPKGTCGDFRLETAKEDVKRQVLTFPTGWKSGRESLVTHEYSTYSGDAMETTSDQR